MPSNEENNRKFNEAQQRKENLKAAHAHGRAESDRNAKTLRDAAAQSNTSQGSSSKPTQQKASGGCAILVGAIGIGATALAWFTVKSIL